MDNRRTRSDRERRHPGTTTVAQTSKSAVSRVSKPAGREHSWSLPIWKSATQQVWKPALRTADAPGAKAGKDAGAPGGDLRRVYPLLLAHFGHRHWWPAETAFEMCVGAILTQNTNWTNVERAIANLKAARVLEPKALYDLNESRLAELIRPAGYFNVKARRLRCFLRVLVEEFGGDLTHLLAGETSVVRERLLAINGVGRETADSMLLYAGGHHRFVIDAYTKRIFHRHGWSAAAADYDELQRLCESALNEKPRERQLDYWQDYHAQLVMVGKHFCRPKDPDCGQCPLKSLLPRPGASV